MASQTINNIGSYLKFVIYEPEEDTFFILDNLIPIGKILEMGAGSGYISLALAEKGFDVTAVDIDPEAINKIKSKNKNIKTVVSDLFKNVDGMYDTIIFNPPYLPGNVNEDRTIFGGKNGQEVIQNFLSQAYEHIEKNGKIFIIFSSFNDIEYLKKKFQRYCFRKINEKKLSFHSIFIYVLWRCEDEIQ